MKTCTKCKRLLPLSMYYFDKTSNSFKSRCKECTRLQIRSWRSKNKSRYYAITRRDKLIARAKKQDIPFSLTLDEVQSMCDTKKCGYCKRSDQLITFDRIMPELGYTYSNCFMACFFCNSLRSNKLTHQQMLQLAPILEKIL